MKTRKHHNNYGAKQIREGKTKEQVKRIAIKLGIPYGKEIKRENRDREIKR